MNIFIMGQPEQYFLNVMREYNYKTGIIYLLTKNCAWVLLAGTSKCLVTGAHMILHSNIHLWLKDIYMLMKSMKYANLPAANGRT